MKLILPLLFSLVLCFAEASPKRQAGLPARRHRRQQQPEPQRLVSLPQYRDEEGDSNDVEGDDGSGNPVKPYWTRLEIMEVQVVSRPINEVVRLKMRLGL